MFGTLLLHFTADNASPAITTTSTGSCRMKRLPMAGRPRPRGDCARHARLFFGRAELGLESAKAGTFTLVPPQAMREDLRKDYDAMAGMVLGDLPALQDEPFA